MSLSSIQRVSGNPSTNVSHLRHSQEVHCVGGVFAMKLVDLHKRYIEWWQRKLGISDYALLWLVFFKGVLFTLLVVWLIE